MRNLINKLNEAAEAYYNTGNPIMSDSKYDALYDKLLEMEKETGIVLSNSPTHKVGAEVLTKLKKVKHNHQMLSLDKCHSEQEVFDFSNEQFVVAMIKLDGLTLSLKYEDGAFVSAETRGNGYEGSDVTEHVKHFTNVPMRINKAGTYIIDGEAIITYNDFNKINEKLPENERYKNPRNLASGSLSLLDMNIVRERNLCFIAWDVIEGASEESLYNNLNEAETLGFTTVPITCPMNPRRNDELLGYELENIKVNNEVLIKCADMLEYPCDGVVWKFDDIVYGKSLGATSHHFRNGIAYKPKQEDVESVLLDIEWTMGKTGQLTPTAVFEPVELDGTIVERASLHNISIMRSLYSNRWYKGLKLKVYKANQIIPQVRSVEDGEYNEKDLIVPYACPICHGLTCVVKDNDSEFLMCTNPECQGKLLGRLNHFVSKKAMDIDGLSEATLQKFIDLGWLTNLSDIYNMESHILELREMDGFGERSCAKLQEAIEKSKDVKLENFITALSIPGVGSSQAKELAKKFKTWDEFCFTEQMNYDFSQLDGFGEIANQKIHEWFSGMYYTDQVSQLARDMRFVQNESWNLENKLNGMTFVITGTLEKFKNRDELVKIIEESGGKVAGSVSKKTSYLINNDTTSESSKNQKAKSLNVKIISEEEFMNLIK